MVGHEHTRVTHLHHIALPYGLSGKDLMFEDEALSDADTWQSQLDLLKGWDEEEVRRVLVGAVALLENFPHRTLGHALVTAMVWERG
jgi:hypothetical protein